MDKKNNPYHIKANQETNTKQVEKFMEWGSAMNQAFVMQALDQLAGAVITSKDELLKQQNAFISPVAWVKCATDWKELRKLATGHDTVEVKDKPYQDVGWRETFYEVVAVITFEIRKDQPTGTVNERHEAGGTGALYELADELTKEFEEIHKNCTWGVDAEFWEEIEAFLHVKLYFPDEKYEPEYLKKKNG